MGLFDFSWVRSAFNSFSLVVGFLLFNFSLASSWGIATPSVAFSYFSLLPVEFPIYVDRKGGGGASGGGGATSFWILEPTEETSPVVVSSCVQEISQIAFASAFDLNTFVNSEFTWDSSSVSTVVKNSYLNDSFPVGSSILNQIVSLASASGKDWQLGSDNKIYTVSVGSYMPVQSPSPEKACSSGFDCCFQNYNGADKTKLIKGFFNPPNTNDQLMLRCTYKGLNTSFPEIENTYNGGYYVSIDDNNSLSLVPDSDVISFIDTLDLCSYESFSLLELIIDDLMPLPDVVEVKSVDPVVSDSVIYTKEDDDGGVLVTEESSVIEFEVEDSIITPVYKDKTDIYKDGELIDSKEDIITSPPFDGGSDKPVIVPPSKPNIDECRDLPESCEFYEFMQEDFSPPDVDDEIDLGGADVGDIDLSSLIGYDFNTGVSASCPLPYSLDLGMFGDFEVSFNPLCEVATSAKPFVVASAMIFAVLIVLGSTKRSS